MAVSVPAFANSTADNQNAFSEGGLPTVTRAPRPRSTRTDEVYLSRLGDFRRFQRKRFDVSTRAATGYGRPLPEAAGKFRNVAV